MCDVLGAYAQCGRFKRGVCEAELAVCKMPPVDDECLEARGEEIKVVDALAAQVRKVVSEATGKGGRLAGDVAPGSANIIMLDKLGQLIREQSVRDVVRHRSWRTLNAVSAVILHQVEPLVLPSFPPLPLPLPLLVPCLVQGQTLDSRRHVAEPA